MPVSVTSAISGPFTPNGATTAFPFTFKAMSEDEVGVLQGGVPITTGFTVTRNSDGDGGTVTFTTAPATGSGDIYLYSDPDFTQDIDFTNTGAFLPESHDEANDRDAVKIIALKHRIDQLLSDEMLDPAERAGMFLAWGAGGVPVPSSGTGTDDGLRADLAATTGNQLVGNVAQVRNVKTYGATGGGSVPDTVAINAAIAACSAGDTLYFPPGTYLVDNSDLHSSNHGDTSTRPLPNGVNVLMDGGAWVKREPSAVGVIFFTCDGNNILQVNVDGDEYPGSMTGTWPAGAASYGVYAGYADSVRIINSRFKNIKSYGVQSRGGNKWLLADSDFYRIGLSGVLFQTIGTVAFGGGKDILHCMVVGCTFEGMGDTATAFVPADNGKELAHNTIAHCTAKNTNYRTLGFAFDFEGGYAFGLYHHNKIIGCTVEQSAGGTDAQGGITMNLFHQDGVIVGNAVQGRLSTAGEIGIWVGGTRRMLVEGNSIRNFRGNAIFADGDLATGVATTGVSILANEIHNCGDAGGGSTMFRSAILLSWDGQVADAVVNGNVLSWDGNYAYGGSNAAAILANRGDLSTTVTNVNVTNNRLRNPLGTGIHMRGFTGGFTIARATIEGNVLIGENSATVFLSNPIAATYCVGLSVQNNRAYEVKAGFDLTGSTNAQVRNNTIENIGAAAAATLASWFNLTSTDKAWVEGNKFNTAAPTAKLVTTSATNLTIKRNDGYKTEGGGTSAAIATGGTIAHGLDVTPTIVLLTANAAAAVKVGAQVGATNITVTHDSGGSTAFFWEARYSA